MAAQCKVGHFNLNAAPGNQSIAGLGFTPVAVIFWTTAIPAISGVNEIRQSIGCATSSTQRWSVVNAFAGTGDATDHQFKTDRCFSANDAFSDVEVMGADFVAMDVNGFTISVTTGDSAQIVNYMAFGGISARAGTFDCAFATTGLKTITGLPFSPKAVFFGVGPHNDTDSISAGNSGSTGWAISNAAQFAHMQYMEGPSPIKANSKLISGACLGSIDSTGAENFKASYTAATADGFQINVIIDPSAATTRVGFLAIGGNVQCDIRTVTEPAVIGSQVISGVGFAPAGIFTMSQGRAATAMASSGVRLQRGAASGNTAQKSSGYLIEDGNTSTGRPVGVSAQTVCVGLPSTTPNVASGIASLTTLDSDGYTFGWTAVDGLSSEIRVFSFGTPNTSTPLTMPVGKTSGYALSFEDTFSSASLDFTKWNRALWFNLGDPVEDPVGVNNFDISSSTVSLAVPTMPFARSASYVVGETSNPDHSTYVFGEPVLLTFWGAGLAAGGTDSLTVTTKDENGVTQGTTVVTVTADGSGNWQTTVSAPNARLGYYKVTAVTGGGKSLPAFGTRFAGYLTYAIVFNPAQRTVFSEGLTRFGMQGSVQANCQDALGYLGVRWQLDSTYRWGDMEPSGPNTYNINDSTPIPDITYRGTPWKTYGMVSVAPNMPSWATVSGPLGNLNASGLANFGAFCTKVANRYIANNPTRTNHLFEITWEPYPGRWTGTDAGFVKIYELAYNAIHAAYTAAGKTCTIMGPTLFPGYTEMDGWITAGLTNYLDMYSVHAYSDQNGATDTLAATLRSDATKFNTAKGSVLPRVNNEAAFTTNSTAPTRTYDESGLTAARGDIKNAIICLGEGFKYTMLFYLADFTDENIGWGYYYNLDPAFGGGYGSDKIGPKIHVPATACMTWLLDGSVSQGEVVGIGGTAFGYRFLRNDGKTVIALADHTTSASRSITVPNGVVDIYDMMGNKTSTTVSTGSLSVTVSQSPTYLLYPGTGIETVPATDAHLRIWPFNNGGHWVGRDLTTFGKFAQATGYWEIKCKMPVNKGIRTSFYLINHDTDDRPIISVFKADPGQTAASGWVDGIGHCIDYEMYVQPVTDGVTIDKTRYSTLSLPAIDLTSASHVFGIEKTAFDVKFYLDGTLIRTVAITGANEMPAEQYMVVSMNYQTGGPAADGATIQSATAAFEVDYVRAWVFGTSSGGVPPTGTLRMSDVKASMEITSNANLSLGDARLRALANRKTGTVKLSDFVGSNEVETFITAARDVPVPPILPSTTGYFRSFWGSASAATLNGIPVVGAYDHNSDNKFVFSLEGNIPRSAFRGLIINNVIFYESDAATYAYQPGPNTTDWTWTGITAGLVAGQTYELSYLIGPDTAVPPTEPPPPPPPPGDPVPPPVVTPVPTPAVSNGQTVDLLSGQVYYGTLDLAGKSNITIRAIGQNGNAVITNGKDIADTAWSVHSGNVWKTAVPAGVTPKIVTNNGIPLPDAHTGTIANPWKTGVTTNGSNQVTIDTEGQSVTGGELIFLATQYLCSHPMTITGQAGNVLTVSNYLPDAPDLSMFDTGQAYLQGKLWMLMASSEPGWAVESGFLYVRTPGGIAPNRVIAASSGTAIDGLNSSNITLQNISVRNAGDGIVARDSTNFVINTSDISSVLYSGIVASGATGFRASNITGKYLGNQGLHSWFMSNGRITNMKIENVAMFGMPRACNSGIYVASHLDVQVRDSNVITCAYNGIGILEPTADTNSTNGSVIDNCIVDRACLTLFDGGGIYTIGRNLVNSHMKINKCTISNMAHHIQCIGIYMDDHTSGVTITGCKVVNCDASIVIHDGRDNLVDNNEFDHAATQHITLAQTAGEGTVRNNVFTHNTIRVRGSEWVYNCEVGNDNNQFGSFNFNTYIYHEGNGAPAFARTWTGSGPGIDHTFQQWRNFIQAGGVGNYDENSTIGTAPATAPAPTVVLNADPLTLYSAIDALTLQYMGTGITPSAINETTGVLGNATDGLANFKKVPDPNNAAKNAFLFQVAQRDAGGTSKRTELAWESGTKGYSLGVTYWQAFRVRIGDNLRNAASTDEAIVWQVHDNSLEDLNPNMSLIATGGSASAKFNLWLKYASSATPSLAANAVARMVYEATYPSNTWITFVVQFRPHHTAGNGAFFKMWRNGILVVNDTLPNDYASGQESNLARRSYQKLGIYHYYDDQWVAGQARTVHHKGIIVYEDNGTITEASMRSLIEAR